MIYLDYSATTMTSREVLDSFVQSSTKYIGNPNSLHKLGVEANNLIAKATSQIANILGVKENEIIYTSGASESNNLALKGIAYKYQNRGKHIITTNFEHSSIYGPLTFLSELGFDVDFVESDDNGIVDLENLKKLIREDTILVSVGAINSEIGIKQPIDEIADVIKECNKKTFFHVDITQAVGKIKLDLKNVDLASFSAHKFFGVKGIGALIKKENINIEPLIHGGKSTTIYRSGTPTLPLIVSTAKALRLAYEDIDIKYNHVLELNKYLKNELSKIDNIHINSNDLCIPHILNLSVVGIKPETFLHALEEYDVYISTQTACSKSGSHSKSVYALTHDEKIASSSIRISISYITTKDEIDKFIEIFKECKTKLTLA
ncbi:MAG: cysteine desulfurase family protein [Bacilli bacterium]|nr:cysteine desulfurase family protein [Bacilli bacterium]